MSPAQFRSLISLASALVCALIASAAEAQAPAPPPSVRRGRRPRHAGASRSRQQPPSPWATDTRRTRCDWPSRLPRWARCPRRSTYSPRWRGARRKMPGWTDCRVELRKHCWGTPVQVKVSGHVKLSKSPGKPGGCGTRTKLSLTGD